MRARSPFISNVFLALLLLSISSCGYRFSARHTSGKIAIAVPYVEGDQSGHLTRELIRQLSGSGHFQVVCKGEKLVLHATLLQDEQARIGFRFDRDPQSGKRLSNLVGVENRRSMTAEVSLVNTITGKTLLGPEQIQAHTDFDYINSDSPWELAFRNPEGEKQKVINFSLGQLDSIEGAQDAATAPLFSMLAQKIVEGIISKKSLVD